MQQHHQLIFPCITRITPMPLNFHPRRITLVIFFLIINQPVRPRLNLPKLIQKHKNPVIIISLQQFSTRQTHMPVLIIFHKKIPLPAGYTILVI